MVVYKSGKEWDTNRSVFFEYVLRPGGDGSIFLIFLDKGGGRRRRFQLG